MLAWLGAYEEYCREETCRQKGFKRTPNGIGWKWKRERNDDQSLRLEAWPSFEPDRNLRSFSLWSSSEQHTNLKHDGRHEPILTSGSRPAVLPKGLQLNDATDTPSEELRALPHDGTIGPYSPHHLEQPDGSASDIGWRPGNWEQFLDARSCQPLWSDPTLYDGND